MSWRGTGAIGTRALSIPEGPVRAEVCWVFPPRKFGRHFIIRMQQVSERDLEARQSGRAERRQANPRNPTADSASNLSVTFLMVTGYIYSSVKDFPKVSLTKTREPGRTRCVGGRLQSRGERGSRTTAMLFSGMRLIQPWRASGIEGNFRSRKFFFVPATNRT